MFNKIPLFVTGIGSLGLFYISYKIYYKKCQNKIIKSKKECVNNIKHEDTHNFTYDLVIIGGGSGGLSAAKQASNFPNKKVAILDYVKPTKNGTQWGIGGTCVNVGCIPKKIFHTAAILGEHIKDQQAFGWNIIETPEHDWSHLMKTVNNYIKKMNTGYEELLKLKNIKYYNALGSFVDKNTIKLTYKNKKTHTITSKNIIISVGGRPTELECIGSDHSITSDDLFWLKKHPGKILIIGASYVALECAGFLAKLGCDVTILIRSIALRGFDQDCSKRILHNLEANGITLIRSVVVSKIIKEKNKKLRVFWIPYNSNNSSLKNKKNNCVFDTVLSSIGRTPDTKGLKVENVNITLKNKYIVCNDDDSCIGMENIFCIGDAALDRPELTPVAIRSGKLLIDRLFNKNTKYMDYNNIATTVFTPLEYGTIGLNEDDILEKKEGSNKNSTSIYDTYINYKLKPGYSVYRKNFTPLEWSLTNTREKKECYMKIIVNPLKQIVGMHYLGPNAGEIIQGFAVSMKMGITLDDLHNTIGIHPTSVERFCILTEKDRKHLHELRPPLHFNFGLTAKSFSFKKTNTEECET